MDNQLKEFVDVMKQELNKLFSIKKLSSLKFELNLILEDIEKSTTTFSEFIDKCKKDDDDSYIKNYIKILLYYVLLTGKRTEEIDSIFLNNILWDMTYCKGVIKGRWQEYENKIIQKNCASSCKEYAIKIINGRWPEAEKIILKDAQSSFLYAKFAIKGRWIEAEPMILDSKYKNWYIEDVMNKYDKEEN